MLYLETQVICCVQTDNWKLGEQLGAGRHGEVFAVTNPRFSNIVLTKGAEYMLRQEADKLWIMDHPNVVRLHALIGSQDFQPGGSRTTFLALDRLYLVRSYVCVSSHPSLILNMSQRHRPFDALHEFIEEFSDQHMQALAGMYLLMVLDAFMLAAHSSCVLHLDCVSTC